MCSKRKFCMFLLTALFYAYLFFFPKKAFATLYINEFSSDTAGSGADQDWVEIYNSGPDAIDLSLYRLRDSTSSNKKDLSGNISGGSFSAFDFSDSLNKTGDTIRLLLISDDVNTVDQVIYGSGGSVGAPSTGQSGGRQTDGGGSWILFSSQTKGSTNNSSTPVPTATLTPTPSLTPTSVPTPTKTPTPTSTPKPAATSTPKPANTATPAPTSKITVTSTPTITLLKAEAKITSKSAVLGEKTAKPTKTPTFTPAPSKNVKKINSTQPIFPQLFMGAGVLCLAGCGILGFRIYQKGKLINNA